MLCLCPNHRSCEIYFVQGSQIWACSIHVIGYKPDQWRAHPSPDFCTFFKRSSIHHEQLSDTSSMAKKYQELNPKRVLTHGLVRCLIKCPLFSLSHFCILDFCSTFLSQFKCQSFNVELFVRWQTPQLLIIAVHKINYCGQIN